MVSAKTSKVYDSLMLHLKRNDLTLPDFIRSLADLYRIPEEVYIQYRANNPEKRQAFRIFALADDAKIDKSFLLTFAEGHAVVMLPNYWRSIAKAMEFSQRQTDELVEIVCPWAEIQQWLSVSYLSEQLQRSVGWVRSKMEAHPDIDTLKRSNNHATTYHKSCLTYLQRQKKKESTTNLQSEDELTAYQISRLVGHSAPWAQARLEDYQVEALPRVNAKGRNVTCYRKSEALHALSALLPPK